MRSFDLFEPRSLEEAAANISEWQDGKVLAGGTALLVLMKQGILFPSRLISLNKIPDAADITFDPRNGLRVGALAKIGDVARHPTVKMHYPLLAEACGVVANVRILNLATIGGNLVHADYQSDPPSVLMGLGASVELMSTRGNRRMPLDSFLVGAYTTALDPHELLVAVTIPPPARGHRGIYIKFTTHSSEDRPCAGVTVSLAGHRGRCTDAMIVIGAACARPTRVAVAEEMLRGEPMSSIDMQAVASAVADNIDPIEDFRGSARYKRKVVGVLVRRSIERLVSSWSDE